MKPRSSVSRTSSGYTSSRMKRRIQSSLASKSGSVEKSQLMRFSLHTLIEKVDALVDHANDGIRQALVHGVWALAAAVQHQVVPEDGRVLVQAHCGVPAHLFGRDAVEPQEVVHRQVDRAAWVGRVDVLAADRHHAQAAEVQQGLPDLRDLPVEKG